MKIHYNMSLAEKTTFGIGEVVPYFIEIINREDLIQAINFIKENQLFYFILGEGSNTIGIDKKLPLAILHPNNHQVIYKIEDKEFHFRLPTSVQYKEFYQITIDEDLLDVLNFYCEKNKRIQIIADAGINWDYFVFFNILHGIGHFTAMSGIPGKVGSTPIQNVGAYGEEIKNFVREVETLLLENRTTTQKIFSNSECQFRYRDSILKKHLNRFYIEKVIFDVSLEKDIPIKYPELEKTFYKEKDLFKLNDFEESSIKSETIKQYFQLRKCVYSIRRKKGMILDGVYSKSAGSFFTNPILTEEEFLQVQKRINHIPYFKENEHYKIPAAWLIEYAGIQKGEKNFHNNVGISPLHALALINYGARFNDLKEFIKYIQEKVYKKTNIILNPEPIFMEDFIYKI